MHPFKSTEQHPRCASLYEGSINMGLFEPSPIPQSCRYHSEETLINQPPRTFWLRLLADVQVFCSAAQTGEGLKKKERQPRPTTIEERLKYDDWPGWWQWRLGRWRYSLLSGSLGLRREKLINECWSALGDAIFILYVSGATHSFYYEVDR